ncbi:hypothetical protein C343_03210 [Cryptococcus neoformans C23]|uniref:t-SNARE coiled-coil homology domain-containing protein n=1 Tax=Cryptococcus neoformans (strain H99 / ATCC 208821 / CBS 10515 / FGSC 9487) TaxID=235443 RepID=J9VR71_CRYN9|nr:hypothetical protein CNAG_01028 [Cryptococcus neoformans var. grubii H99]AUB24870.1 hypothetical protein CKF44_01028 [Cryptococcus neoformans var. grubii]OWZ32573.1 hypothetical protein C347_03273 [Cryptococcus neoformans var. grubii AD2-60a]OWZ43459.1 hypothetical protein C353_03114 [Cryptococcus neoformans var. grubii AD1-83a]OWZ44420.1 hypothetical protein C343_03210 [Cryptococcus neoformans var. grubii C23]OWZ57563.1 hypothetical protein C368_00728 [Cryptococcus neoformans var. grubii 1|eukprot:XP_012049090.1 hypothetical protein CNAG_01028 [Cryptococcus neoformans var. grubii H99]
MSAIISSHNDTPDMATDPYIDLKREVEASLSTIHSLTQNHPDIFRKSSSPETVQAQEELRGALSMLETDVEDLEESVRVVEDMGERWGLGTNEVHKRRDFVQRVKREVESLRYKVYHIGPSTPKGKGKDDASGRYRDEPADLERGYDEDEVRRWEAQEQEMLVKKQDDTLGIISGTLHTLASQAGLIGHEVHEQNEMLDDLSTRVEHTDSKLRKVQRTMGDFIRRNEETKSGWCILILIIVLMILLLLVIIT